MQSLPDWFNYDHGMLNTDKNQNKDSNQIHPKLKRGFANDQFPIIFHYCYQIVLSVCLKLYHIIVSSLSKTTQVMIFSQS